jgi:signal transduction histidine kinase/ActR/RegA family two-component response regulator
MVQPDFTTTRFGMLLYDDANDRFVEGVDFDLAQPDGLWPHENAMRIDHGDEAWVYYHAPVRIPASVDGWEARIHAEDLPAVRRAVRDHLEGGGRLDVLARVQALRGEYRWFRARAAVQRDARGRPIRIAGSLQDVSAEKGAEQALGAALQAAEAAAQVKSAFLAQMSHELRTPMTSVLGFAEDLLDPELSLADRHFTLRMILRGGKHQLRLINDVLDLSKIEAGKLQVELSQESPFELLDSVESLMRGLAQEKALNLQFEYVTKMPESIRSDATRVRQILINLVGNALKFTEKGTILVLVRFQNELRPELEFTIVDSGIGMSREQIARVFDSFVQADASTSRRYGGTGLGLSISKKLAQLLGGDILASSTPGSGSIFRVLIPTGPIDPMRLLSPDEFLLERKKASEIVASPFVPERPLDCRILYAEDTETNQRLVQRILEKAGARVTIAIDGREAVSRAMEAIEQNDPYQVILMDMQMPVMDGLEACRTLRGRGVETPIIALSASILESDRERCQEAGCNDFAEKPIRRERLLHQIRAAFPARTSESA